MEAGKYSDAITVFETLGGYKDSVTKIKNIYIVGSYSAINNCTIYWSNDKESIWSIDNLTEVESTVVPTANDNISAAILTILSENEASYIGMQFKAGDEIDEIGVTEHKPTIENIDE